MRYPSFSAVLHWLRSGRPSTTDSYTDRMHVTWFTRFGTGKAQSMLWIATHERKINGHVQYIMVIQIDFWLTRLAKWILRWMNQCWWHHQRRFIFCFCASNSVALHHAMLYLSQLYPHYNIALQCEYYGVSSHSTVTCGDNASFDNVQRVFLIRIIRRRKVCVIIPWHSFSVKAMHNGK